MVEPIKVSVIVALYNTGVGLHGLIDSLDRQTMQASDFEVVLVDDGSTDDTLEIARELARTRTNLLVESIPNSGWPGRPRNVGIDLANGEYVFFSDHDDALGARALDSLYRFAAENRSDIVYGKIVRVGRVTPYWSVWQCDVPIADTAGPVVSSRTVHKLFRRQFLLDHDLRFREGRVRLEDHEFMARALPAAEVVSILASEPCYYWIHRNDGTNASNQSVSDDVYWGHYAYTLRSWEHNAGPGPLLDAARTISIVQAFSRFPPSSYLARPVELQDSLVVSLGRMVRDHFPPELDERLTVLKRLSVRALRAGDRAELTRIQQFRRTFSTTLHTTAIDERDGRLLVQVRASLARADRRSVETAVTPAGKRLGSRRINRLRRKFSTTLHPIARGGPQAPAVPVRAELGSAAAPEPLQLDTGSGRIMLRLPWLPEGDERASELAREDLGTVEITIRHRASGVEWPVPNQRQAPRARPALVADVEAEIDTQVDAFGAPLESGIWDVQARIAFLGEASIRRVPVPAGFRAGRQGTQASTAYTTRDNTLAFKVPRAAEPDRM